MKTNSIKTEFKSENKILKGILHLPQSENPPLVIGSHGLEGSKDSAKQTALAKLLPGAGIAFFRFDHRGCGESDGNFEIDTSLDTRSTDMINGLNHALSLNHTSRRFALFGSSLGGATCIETWGRLALKNITPLGMVICAAPVKSITIEKIPLNGNAHRPALPLSFFRDNLLFDISAKTASINNILIFHGDNDKTVPVENGYNIYNNAKTPKKLIIQKNGDHQMSNDKDQQDFNREAPAWFKKCFL
ncbi:MAG: alpha/beta hydrolase [Thermodesulfobacteriota bacterium]|nr:alpha/beta hydrolase [Thermodesulfobacteriota bacterium]